MAAAYTQGIKKSNVFSTQFYNYLVVLLRVAQIIKESDNIIMDNYLFIKIIWIKSLFER